ncbi:hypothetical protein [Okeania hirsuta]|nr:hypothetical protein [Okeania hirsuta]
MKEEISYNRNKVQRYFRDSIWKMRGNPAFPEHDNQGFRNPENPGNDVFIVGDSWTYGACPGGALLKEKSWPILLSQNFGINCAAAGGWGPFQYLLAVKELMPVATKVCLVGFYIGNDLVDAFGWTKNTQSSLRNHFWCDEFDQKSDPITKWNNRVRRRQIQEIMEEKGISETEAFIYAHQCDNIDLVAVTIKGFQHIFKPRLRADTTDLSIPGIRIGLDITQSMFSEIIDICDNYGIEPFFVIFPSKEASFAAANPGLHHEVDTVLSHEVKVKKELKAFFNEHYVCNTDMIEVLSKQPELFFFPNSLDGHPNSEGAKVIATHLEEVLSPLLEEFDENNYPLA